MVLIAHPQVGCTHFKIILALLTPLAAAFSAVAAPGPSPSLRRIGPPTIEDERKGPDIRRHLSSANAKVAVAYIDSLAREGRIDLNSPPPPEPAPRDYRIRLGDEVWTPSAGAADSVVELAARLVAGDSDALADYPDGQIPVLLQFHRPPTWSEVRALCVLGVLGLTNEINRTTLLVLLPADNLGDVAQLAVIRSVLAYPDSAKLTVPYSGIDRGRVWVIDFDRPEHRADLVKLGCADFRYEPSLRAYVGSITQAQEEAISQLPWVKHLAFNRPIELLQNFEPDDSREVCSVDAVSSWSGGTAGSGVVIGVYDDGIDDTHPDFPPTILVGGDPADAGAEHGTHVCGIIASRGTRPLVGQHDAAGMSPGAFLCVVDHDVSAYDEAHAEFANQNAVVSNHSWGWPVGSYDTDTQAIDGYIDDGQLWVFAAGNDGYIVNPATAKNGITVGAISYVTDPDDGSEFLGAVTSYSGKGPTQSNQRLKPEIVAPGGNMSYIDGRRHDTYGVVSATATDWSAPGSWAGQRDGVFEFPEWPADDFYVRFSGTSMAAPHVTGALGITYAGAGGMTAEVAKALLIGTAIPLENSGPDPTSGYANTDAGFGLLNAFGASGYWYSTEEHLLLYGVGHIYASETDVFSFEVPATTDRLVATLAYNDHNGSPTGEIDDNLDITLLTPAGPVSYSEPAGCSAEGTVEKIIIEDPLQHGPEPWGVAVEQDWGWPWDNQDYCVIVRAILHTPALHVSAQLPQSTLLPGENFELPVSVTNAGGWIAAGVHVWTDGGDLQGDDAGAKRFVGNLMYQGHVRSRNLSLTAPSAPGTYSFRVRADGVNRGLPEATSDWLTFDVETGGYTIMAVAGAHGSIDPSGSVSVPEGDDQTFTADPDSGYGVDTWYLDGSPVLTDETSYTLYDVQANHTVLVTFEPGAGGGDITVTSPAEGSQYRRCRNMYIAWTSDGDIGDYVAPPPPPPPPRALSGR